MNEKSEIKSCGVLVFRHEPDHSFLLMQHQDRWDLPKGHVDDGETEIQCALRELFEETGIAVNDITVDPDFRFCHSYDVFLHQHNFEPRSKQLIVFLATLNHPVDIRPTEHIGSKWVEWNPPHTIQSKSIDPLLRAVDEHWSGGGNV